MVDCITAGTMGDDGAVFLAGSTYGVWSGSSSGKIYFAAVRLDANGTELGRW